MPDKYPMLPGHTLIIAQQHLSCYAAATDALLSELETVVSRIRRFLEEAYNSPVLIFENGIAGQTVFHAHLHLVPVRISDLPAAVTQHGDIVPTTGWDEVRQYYVVNGAYRYVQLCDSRYIIAGYSPVLHTMRRVMAETTGLAWSGNGWVKATTPEDVADLSRRWQEWTAVSDGIDR